jgi:thiol-disulfide isomerase/thioredoxin
MNDIAESRKGKFISTQYTGSGEKHLWQCHRGHTWEAVPKFIKQGDWCPHCAGVAKLTEKHMHDLAEKNSGKFLSIKYIGALKKHIWLCNKGHIFEARPNDVQQGKWCRKCYFERKKLTIEYMHTVAEKNGGKFLSEKYVGSFNKCAWQCNQGHVWDTTYSTIRNGAWCPYCASFRSEEICRNIISKMFGWLFVKCRPDFLMSDKGRNLELDGFCEELNLAFEYHGAQHFEPVEYFGGQKTFEAIQKRDKLKLELCAKAGVRVIVVPTFPANFDKLICQHMVEQAIVATGIQIPATWTRAVSLIFA